MKLFKLTNLKTGKVVKTNATEADIEALKKWIPDPGQPQINGLSKFQVEEFEVNERGGQTFVPPYMKKPSTPAGVPQGKPKGPAAAGQN